MHPLRGILLMILAVTLFTAMSAMIKAAADVPPGQAVFFRSSIAMPLVMGWLWAQGRLSGGLRTQNPWGHAWRGIAGTTAMGLGFAGLHLLPLPEVTAIRFATPLLIVVFAALFLGERLRLIRLSAVLVGLLGVVVILWPRLSLSGGGSEALGAIMVLGSAGFAAVAQIFVKSMAGVERTAAIVFYFSLTATVLSLLTLPFGWVVPDRFELVMLVGAGLIGGVGQILLTASYRFADASVLAPFTYVSMLWALLFGWALFSELPTASMLFGAGLIIAAGVAIVLRERQLGLRRTAERKMLAQGK
ncbi:MAG: DMT family transporter [Brevirhabdus sp.]